MRTYTSQIGFDRMVTKAARTDWCMPVGKYFNLKLDTVNSQFSYCDSSFYHCILAGEASYKNCRFGDTCKVWHGLFTNCAFLSARALRSTNMRFGTGCTINGVALLGPTVYSVTGFGRYARTTYGIPHTAGVHVVCGCFEGNLEEFRARARATLESTAQYLLVADLFEERWAALKQRGE